LRIEREARAFARKELEKAYRERLAAVPGYTDRRKCEVLYYLASTVKTPGVIVEIGSYKGKSTAWLAEAARRTGRRLVTMDPHLTDSLEAFDGVVKAFAIEEVATIHRDYSYNVAKGWREAIALLWIDGSHEYEAVKRDIEDFSPHVAAGGWIVFDDADVRTYPGVVRAIGETLEKDARFRKAAQLRQVAVFQRV
jgi:predicted O-methyltransferase YrrM